MRGLLLIVVIIALSVVLPAQYVVKSVLLLALVLVGVFCMLKYKRTGGPIFNKFERTATHENVNTADEWVFPSDGTYYHLLGVSPTATAQEIKHAYWQRVQNVHPDKHFYITAEEKKRATEQFLTIQKAYEILKDPVQRRLYDHSLLIPRTPILKDEESTTDEGLDWNFKVVFIVVFVVHLIRMVVILNE